MSEAVSTAAPVTADQTAALSQAALAMLASMLKRSSRCVVLTGAGVSTESGIPDYRDHNGAWKRTPPMQYQEFIGSHAARQRYWARALIGWQQFRGVVPNRAHHALTTLQQAGIVHTIITQNVDGLHQRAGSHDVIDLHGRIDLVECLQCKRTSPREQMQVKLSERNPDWTMLNAEMAPDGDALLERTDFSSFDIPHCEHCTGPLKPAVVFFGENVPAQVVDAAYAAVRSADLLLVAGSSLMVMSGHRFVREARVLNMSIAVINIGRTRADGEVSLKIEASCGEVLQWLVSAVLPLPVELPG
jgi:NAD-dependent SIR2 family protein deacetylase